MHILHVNYSILNKLIEYIFNFQLKRYMKIECISEFQLKYLIRISWHSNHCAMNETKFLNLFIKNIKIL